MCHFPKTYKFNNTIAIITFYGVVVKKSLYSTNLRLFKHHNILVKKLKLLIDNNISIVFFESLSSQHAKICAGIFELFKKNIKSQISCVISTQPNKYSKPYTHMWNFLSRIFAINGNTTLNVSKSLYVGIHAGRKFNHHIKNDISCVDRSFAQNVGLKFTTANAFFQNDVMPFKWSWSFKPNKKDRELLMRSPNNVNILNKLDEIVDTHADKKIIIITGLKCSGKTTLSKKIHNLWKNNKPLDTISYVDIDNKNYIDEINDDMNKNIIMNIDIQCKKLLYILKNSMTYKIPTVLVDLKTPNELRSLFNHMQVQTSTLSSVVYSQDKVKKKDYNIFQKSKTIEYITAQPVIIATDEYWYKYG